MVKPGQLPIRCFFTTVDSLYHQVVMANKDSFWGPLMMISFTSYLSEDMKPWYEALSSAAKESYYGAEGKKKSFIRQVKKVR